MNIQTIPLFEIQRAKYNPRKTLKPGDPAYDKLKKAVVTFGLVEPLVWNSRTKNLVGGHQRLSILEETGASHVEVSVVDLDERDEKALNLALNKHAGEWDFVSLAEILKELNAGPMDMDATGFSAAELERLMRYAAPTAGLTDEDAVPEPPKTPITTPGDVWILGKHRLRCGDATLAVDAAALLAGAKPNLMVTDPPYGVQYDPKWRAAAGVNKNKAKMGAVANDDRCDWRAAWVLFPGSIAYVWHAGRHASEVQASLEACEFDIRSQIIWAKERFALSRGHYHWQHEPCWYAVKRGAAGAWLGGRSQSTLWEINAREDAGLGHGTQKPVACMRRPILNHTEPGDCVYEPFSGSGTSIIAAESSGRICYAMEIEPAYVDVAVKRWEAFTGRTATLETHEPAKANKAKAHSRNKPQGPRPAQRTEARH